MNFRTTLILFVLVVAGLIFFIVANRSGTADDTSRDASSSTNNPTEGRKLLDVKPEDVQKLVIRPADGQALELVRAEPEKTTAAPPAQPAGAGLDWKIVQPAAWPADGFEARALAELVVNLRSRGRVEAGADKSSFGLDKPRYTVEVTDKSNKTSKLLIGNQSALGNDLYVDSGDGKGVSMATGGALADKLEKGTQKLFESLRDKRLVNAAAGTDVKQVEVTPRKGPKLVLRKDGVDWKMVEPKQVPADAGEVSSLLSSVTALRADEFVANDSPEVAGAMIDQPKLTVWFSKDAPRTQPASAPATGPATRPSGTTVAFGQFANIEKDKMYVKVSPEPGVLAKVSMSEASWEKLATASPVTLRDRRAVDIDSERVERVAISVDKAATTQPTTRPAEKRELVLERRRETPKAGEKPAARTELDGGARVILASQETPAAPPAPATAAKGQATAGAQAAAGTAPVTAPATAPVTKPATAPATGPATGPATAPSAPPTKWVLVTGGKRVDADDVKVETLLGGLHPLRANKYLESPPTTPVTATYTLKVHVNAYGDQPARDEELKLTETGTGTDAKVIGQYHDLVFEVEKFFLDRVTAEFDKKKDAQATQPVAAAE